MKFYGLLIIKLRFLMNVVVFCSDSGSSDNINKLNDNLTNLNAKIQNSCSIGTKETQENPMNNNQSEVASKSVDTETFLLNTIMNNFYLEEIQDLTFEIVEDNLVHLLSTTNPATIRFYMNFAFSYDNLDVFSNLDKIFLVMQKLVQLYTDTKKLNSKTDLSYPISLKIKELYVLYKSNEILAERIGTDLIHTDSYIEKQGIMSFSNGEKVFNLRMLMNIVEIIVTYQSYLADHILNEYNFNTQLEESAKFQIEIDDSYIKKYIASSNEIKANCRALEKTLVSYIPLFHRDNSSEPSMCVFDFYITVLNKLNLIVSEIKSEIKKYE